ncbi:MAG TPA: outer membrane beta-barrel protein [Bacteroidia bacterium]|nr:outer membrane beta-barrel protein [Bacteroidia bacterium]HRH07978.1 outer membrane beta-barrel protein [Bacteroidia bacterium]HRH63109.1 outer membrane beta-barrel protein [Bacteroidia bacterium]
MKKTANLYLMLLLVNSLFAQNRSGQYICKHLVRADASIIAGSLHKTGANTVHLNGNLEYYLDSRISIRGDVNWLAGLKQSVIAPSYLKDYYSVMLGGLYHFQTSNHLDPYLVFQPGIAYASAYAIGNENRQNLILSAERVAYSGSIAPLGSVGVGFNYYFQQFAHLFAEGRYVYGNLNSNAPAIVSLQELRITFGLGFNLFVAKKN